MTEGRYYLTPYYRISHEDGDFAAQGKNESDSIRNQRSLVEAYVRDRPEIVLAEERVDDGFSGLSFNRPAFQQMLEDIKAGRTDGVIVKDLSRFGRNYIEVGRFVQKIFPYLGVRFIAINDHYDSLEACGGEEDLMLSFKNLMNDSYSRDLSVKVRSQLAVKQKRGEFIGSFAPYGYEKDEKDRNRLLIDPYGALVVRDIFRWRIEGMSNEKIANRLNDLGVLPPAEYKRMQGLKYRTGFLREGKGRWRAASVARILSNKVYLGWMVQGKKTTVSYKVKKLVEKSPGDWVLVKGMHEPVVTEEEFRIVQNLAALDMRIPPGESQVYKFSGLVICGGCKGNMVRKVVSAGKDSAGRVRKYPYFVCANHKRDSRCCSSHMVREKSLETVVLAVLRGYMEFLPECGSAAKGTDQGGWAAESMEARLRKIQQEAANRRDLERALHEDWEAGLLEWEEYQDLQQIYQSQIDQWEREARRMKEERQVGGGRNGDFALSRSFLLAMLEMVEVMEKSRIRIRFRFSHVSCRAIGPEAGGKIL